AFMVEDAPKRAGMSEREKRRARRCVLQQRRVKCECAVFRRPLSQEFEHPPEFALEFGRDRDAGAGKYSRDPVERPGAFTRIIDAAERFQSEGALLAQIEEVSAEPKHSRADRALLIENEDLRIFVAQPLRGERGEQHRLAGAGRTNHERMADIADMSA